MSLAPTPLNLAALGCIVSGSCATGIGASVSFLVMPALIRPDVPQDALIHQWHGIYKRGAAPDAGAGRLDGAGLLARGLPVDGVRIGMARVRGRRRVDPGHCPLHLGRHDADHPRARGRDGGGGRHRKHERKGQQQDEDEPRDRGGFAGEVDAVECGALLDSLGGNRVRRMEPAWLNRRKGFGGNKTIHIVTVTN
ncbi:hypothetical protein PG995_015745, partial [Apiospora arundinis]